MSSLDDCVLPCQMARRMAERAAEILAGRADVSWDITFHALACEPGQVKLTHSGGPTGRVPLGFQAEFWSAVAIYAQEQVGAIALEKMRRLAKQRQEVRPN